MLVTICLLGVLASLDGRNERVATDRAIALENGVKTYYSQNGQWPAKLTDVAPLVEDPKTAFVSPWGAPYQFILVRDEKSKVTPYTPYIWTEREVNGKARV